MRWSLASLADHDARGTHPGSLSSPVVDVRIHFALQLGDVTDVEVEFGGIRWERCRFTPTKPRGVRFAAVALVGDALRNAVVDAKMLCRVHGLCTHVTGVVGLGLARLFWEVSSIAAEHEAIDVERGEGDPTSQEGTVNASRRSSNASYETEPRDLFARRWAMGDEKTAHW